ncbi:unnamed protein product [Closterium sp. NIES-65]|nr:unnamed protein product [Closterium sp. NIES-65]
MFAHSNCGKEATGDENDFTEGEGTTYPISEEIVQLQAKVATLNITILQQQTSIDGLKKHTQNLEARLSITMKEVTEFRRSLGTKNREIEWLQKTCNNLQVSFNKLNEQVTKLRREGIYEPPPGRRPAPAAQSAPAPPAPPAVGAATAMHQPPPTETSPFGSLSAPLPEFNHRKTEVQPWLDLVNETMILANVRPEARVTAATRALDEVARRAVYGAKKQAHGPFGWPEFCTALKEAFMEYAVELEAAARSLQKPLSEEEMMHLFMKGLPVNLQEAHMIGGMTNWTTYKELKEQVIKTDTVIRTYIHGPAKADQQPRAEGSGGRGNRPQNANGGGGSNKRPFQQREHQPGPQAKRANGGGGHGPNKPDFSKMRCHGCGFIGHIQKQCRNKNPIKYSGKPKPGGAGPSGKKDFQKPN